MEPRGLGKDRQAGPPVAMMNRGICVFTRNLTGPTRIWLKSNIAVDVFVLWAIRNRFIKNPSEGGGKGYHWEIINCF